MNHVAWLFLWFTCVSVSLAAETPRESEIDDIREAVFRWQFEHNASGIRWRLDHKLSGQMTSTPVYFLKVDEKGSDPTDEFMKRFTDHRPSVRKVSASSADAQKGVRDKKTGEQGLIFWVMKITSRADIAVEVKGGYYEAGLSASSNTYTVKKQNGKWEVTNDRMDSISQMIRTESAVKSPIALQHKFRQLLGNFPQFSSR